MTEERTDILVEIKLSDGKIRRVSLRVAETLNPEREGDVSYLDGTVLGLYYMIEDQMKSDICIENGTHPDAEIKIQDFTVNDWWFN